MQPDREPAHAAVFRLFRDGYTLESIRSGWRLSEEAIAKTLLDGFRAGEKVDPEWLLPTRIKDRVIETIRQNPDLGTIEIAARFDNKVSPALVRVLRETTGAQGTVDTRFFNEVSAPKAFAADIEAAKKEIIVVAPAVKGREWRRHLVGMKRVIDGGGAVAFFAATFSELVKEEIKNEGIVLIEKRTAADLAVIDGRILWEGSYSFLAPPVGEEHARRTASRLQCDEVKDLHDLYV